MFDNIGKKIKITTCIMCWIGIIISVVAGIIMLIFGFGSDEELIIPGFVVLFVVPVVLWINSFCVYGFGELVDKVCDIEVNTRG